MILPGGDNETQTLKNDPIQPGPRGEAVRSEIAKCPNKEFAKMVDVDSMSDGDMLDFALRMTWFLLQRLAVGDGQTSNGES